MADYIDKMKNYEEIFWINPDFISPAEEPQDAEKIVDIDDAEARLARFAPFIRRMFPEVEDGIIESPLTSLKSTEDGRFFLKQDSHLPISGSIKARGGIYEVLKLAETLAVEAGLLLWNPDTDIDPEMERFIQAVYGAPAASYISEYIALMEAAHKETGLHIKHYPSRRPSGLRKTMS